MKDSYGNVFVSIWSTPHEGGGYVHVPSGNLLPRDALADPKIGRLEHLKGDWWTYWAHQ